MPFSFALSSALKRIVAKRPFVISRSTFPSLGMYSGHWLGDNKSLWTDLYISIGGQIIQNDVSPILQLNKLLLLF